MSGILSGEYLFVELRARGEVSDRYFQPREWEEGIRDDLYQGGSAFVHNTGKTYDYADKPRVEVSPPLYATGEWRILEEARAPVGDGAENGATVIIYIENFEQERKISGIKTLRDITDLGLAEAKYFIEHLPQSLQLRFTGSQEALLDDLRQAGLTIRIQGA